MARGRKADKGTYEAREKINLICDTIDTIKLLSDDAKIRVIKAVKFGLGIKEEEKIVVQEEKEIVTPIKEKKTTKKENPDNSGDEYFSPEKCYEANKD